MAKIRLVAIRIVDARMGMISLAITAKAPFPDELVDARTVAEGMLMLKAYAAKAQDTNIPMQLNAWVAKGSRAPNGWNKAEARGELTVRVNLDKLEDKAGADAQKRQDEYERGEHHE